MYLSTLHGRLKDWVADPFYHLTIIMIQSGNSYDTIYYGTIYCYDTIVTGNLSYSKSKFCSNDSPRL